MEQKVKRELQKLNQSESTYKNWRNERTKDIRRMRKAKETNTRPYGRAIRMRTDYNRKLANIRARRKRLLAKGEKG